MGERSGSGHNQGVTAEVGPSSSYHGRDRGAAAEEDAISEQQLRLTGLGSGS